jgi:very-short-patch-repair endonuclease
MRRDLEMKRRARELRNRSNPIEGIVWTHLRDRRLGGFKFRRQHVVDSFVADFYCAKAHLIVELDGTSHDGKEHDDVIRQKRLEERGYVVLRFRNQDVYENLEGFLVRILDACRNARGAGMHTAPHPNPLPADGERE